MRSVGGGREQISHGGVFWGGTGVYQFFSFESGKLLPSLHPHPNTKEGCEIIGRVPCMNKQKYSSFFRGERGKKGEEVIPSFSNHSSFFS